jgi:transcriptional regulator with XRE-family HTH domain
MGASRQRQQRLAGKLLQIRLNFGLSQSEMLKRLDVGDLIVYNQISRYETGSHEPPLQILLQYARVAGVHLEVIVDDELDLPEKLPGRVRYISIKHKPSASSKKR